ncbi:MAG: NUDIX domain-containing protein [Candidatus Liptonbacteria bacterium]|nr:NUDIX domain-containing protein [Candidatus Liptonbacteria bacterium]
MKGKVDKLTADDPFRLWEEQAFAESGVIVRAEPDKERKIPVQLMVRFEIWGQLPENRGKLMLVHNFADTSKDQTEKGRPTGWGLPGGKVKPEETPQQALEHEKGELGHPIIGTPVYSHKFDVYHGAKTDKSGVVKDAWIERIYVFRATIDERTTIERTEEEAREVDKSEFIPFGNIPNAELVDTRDDAPPQPDDGVFRVFASHKNYAIAWGTKAGWRFNASEMRWQAPASMVVSAEK